MSDPLKGCSWRYIKRNMACLDPSHFIEDMFMGMDFPLLFLIAYRWYILWYSPWNISKTRKKKPLNLSCESLWGAFGSHPNPNHPRFRAGHVVQRRFQLVRLGWKILTMGEWRFTHEKWWQMVVSPRKMVKHAGWTWFNHENDVLMKI